MTEWFLTQLTAVFWQIAGALSWSQWAVLILFISIVFSAMVKLPGMILSVLTLPLRLIAGGKKKTSAAPLMVAPLALVAAGAVWWAWRTPVPEPAAPPAPPPPSAKVTMPRLPAFTPPNIKMPDIDLSGIGKGISDLFSGMKPAKSEAVSHESKPVAVAREDRNAMRRRRIRAAAWRADQEQAAREIDAYINAGLNEAARQEAMHEAWLQEFWRRSMGGR